MHGGRFMKNGLFSRVKPNGVDALGAVEVRRGNELLQLRAADGTPVWVAWRTAEGASP